MHQHRFERAYLRRDVKRHTTSYSGQWTTGQWP
jgi:hypothetical protein